ncbi:MAG: rhomboid family intramembrane serine protease [Cyclobacteriaceae bacterium]
MQTSFADEIKNVFRKPDNGLWQLIAINVGLWLFLRIVEVILTITGVSSWGKAKALYLEYLGLPSALDHLLVRPWTLVTTFFTHYDFFHILFNMLILYWFGRILKEYLGNKKLLNTYILGGLSGGLLFILISNISPLFEGVVTGSSLIGASAGVLAVVVGAATLMPEYQIHLILLGPVRIKYIAGVLVLMSLLGTIGENAGGDIAHLGGAMIGFFYIRQLQKGTDWGAWVQSVLSFFRSFFVRPSNIKVTHKKPKKSRAAKTKKPASAKGATSIEQDEIDAILDKISASGYESLTKAEKQKLFNASKK